METLLTFGLSNALTAAVLAFVAAGIARITRRPALWYALWLVVLLRLLAPPIFAVDLVDSRTRPRRSLTRRRRRLGEWWDGLSREVWGLAESRRSHRRDLGGRGHGRDRVRHRPIESAASDSRRRKAGSRQDRRPGGGPCPTIGPAPRTPHHRGAGPGSAHAVGIPRFGAADPPNRAPDSPRHERDRHPARPRTRPSRRRDHWVRHLELAALAIFWWNPVAWWATTRVRRAQELCCDQRVAELLPDHRRAYADTLVETARFLSGRRLPLGSPARAMADLSQMKGRIRMIMGNPHPGRLSLTTKIVAAVVLARSRCHHPDAHRTARGIRLQRRSPSLFRLKDADLNDVLSTFAKISGYEILVEPGITGTSHHERGSGAVGRRAGLHRSGSGSGVGAKRKSDRHQESRQRATGARQTGQTESSGVAAPRDRQIDRPSSMSRAARSSPRRRSRNCRRSTHPRCAKPESADWWSLNSSSTRTAW